MSIHISVVVPFYNEKGNITPLVEQISSALSETDKTFEIVLVDDASTDGSFDEAVECTKTHKELRILQLNVNSGQSEAIIAGIRNANGLLVATLDADLQNDPADIPLLLENMGDFDMICGYRAKRNDNWWRRLCSKIANWVRRMICPDPVRDTGCSLKLFKKEIYDFAPYFRGGHRFLATLAVAQGYTVTEMAVKHHARTCGVTKYGAWGRLKKSFFDLFGMSWLMSRRIRAKVAKEVSGKQVI